MAFSILNWVNQRVSVTSIDNKTITGKFENADPEFNVLVLTDDDGEIYGIPLTAVRYISLLSK